MPPDLFSKPDIPSDIFAPPVIKDDINVTETSPEEKDYDDNYEDDDFEDSSVSGSINSKSMEAVSKEMKPDESEVKVEPKNESEVESEVDPDANTDEKSEQSEVESEQSNVESAKTDAEPNVESVVDTAEQQPKPNTPIDASKIVPTTPSKTSQQVVPTNEIKPLVSKKKLNKLIQESKQGIFEVPDIPMNIFDLPNIIDNIDNIDKNDKNDKNEDSVLNTTVVESNTKGKSNTNVKSDTINESDTNVESDPENKRDANDASDADVESDADDKSDTEGKSDAIDAIDDTKPDSTVASQGEVSNKKHVSEPEPEPVSKDDSTQSTITPPKETETRVVESTNIKPNQPTLEKESLDSSKNINKLIQESKQGIFEVPDIPMNIFGVPSVTNEEHEEQPVTEEVKKPVVPTTPVDSVPVPGITENIKDIKEKVATAVRIYIETNKQIMKEDSTDIEDDDEDYDDDFEDEEKDPTVDEEKIEASVRIARAIYKHLLTQKQIQSLPHAPTGPVPKSLVEILQEYMKNKKKVEEVEEVESVVDSISISSNESSDSEDDKTINDINRRIQDVAKVAIAVHNENINKSTKKEDIGKIEAAIRTSLAVQDKITEAALAVVEDMKNDSDSGHTTDESDDDITKNVENAAKISIAVLNHLKEQQNSTNKPVDSIKDDHPSIGHNSLPPNDNKSTKFNTENIERAVRVVFAVQNKLKANADNIKVVPTVISTDSTDSTVHIDQGDEIKNIENKVGTAARVSLAAQEEAKKQIDNTVDNTVDTVVQKPTVQVDTNKLKYLVRVANKVKKSLQDANERLISENKSVDESVKPIVDENNNIKDTVGTAVRVSRAAQEEAKKQSSSVQVNKDDLEKFVRVANQVIQDTKSPSTVQPGQADLENAVSTAVRVSKNVSENVNKQNVSTETTVNETNNIKDTVGTAVQVSRAAQEEANKLPSVQPGHDDLENAVSTVVRVSENVSEKVNKQNVSTEKTTVDKKYIETLVRAAVAIQEYINKSSNIGSVDSHNEKETPTVEVDTDTLKTALSAGIAARNYINKPSSTVKESDISSIQNSVLAAIAVENEINKRDASDNDGNSQDSSQVSSQDENKSSIDKIHLGTIIRVVLAVKKHLKSTRSGESIRKIKNDINNIKGPLVTSSSGTDKNTTNRTGVIYTINNAEKPIRKLFQ